MKWLKESAQKKDDDIRIYDSLAREIIDTYNNRVRTRTLFYNATTLHIGLIKVGS